MILTMRIIAGKAQHPPPLTEQIIPFTGGIRLTGQEVDYRIIDFNPAIIVPVHQLVLTVMRYFLPVRMVHNH